MKISIVTAVYNREKTLKDTIESILKQEYQDIEYIIIDGASTDNTLDIIKSYEPKFNGKMRYISEPDSGLYNAINKGLKLATGDVLGILNSDDFLASEKSISHIAKAFAPKDIDCVYGNCQMVKAEDLNKVVRSYTPNAYKEGSFLKGWHPPHPTFYMKRSLFEKYGYYLESMKIASDFELMLRYFEKHKVKSAYVNETILKMRVGGVSTTFKGYINSNLEVRRILKSYGVKFPLLSIAKKTAPKLLNSIKEKFKR